MTPATPKAKGTVSRSKLRRAVADYIRSEGCDCCSDCEKHAEDKRRLAELLNVPLYDDASGYDFGLFETPRKPRR